MNGRMSRILGWFSMQCRARRLLAGSQQHERLVRKIGRAGERAAAGRLPSALWKRHGQTIYRQFKWDPEQVPAEARILCRQLQMLEAHLTELARHLGPAMPAPPAGPRAAAQPIGRLRLAAAR